MKLLDSYLKHIQFINRNLNFLSRYFKLEEKPQPSSKAKEAEDPMIHFVNPHGGFMPYSTLSLAGTNIQRSYCTIL